MDSDKKLRKYYNIEVSELLNGSSTDDIIRNIMCDIPWALQLLPEERESSNKSNEMSNMNGNNSNRGKRKRTGTGKRTDGLSRLAKTTATSRISRQMDANGNTHPQTHIHNTNTTQQVNTKARMEPTPRRAENLLK